MGKDIEPPIEPFLSYIDDFFELNTCRSTTALAPISFIDIYNFATIKGIEDFDEYLYLIRRLDKVYMEQNKDN